MFKVGDAVRVKGQRGRPRRWIVVDSNPSDIGTVVIESFNGEARTVALAELAEYPSRMESEGPDNVSPD